jgi:predicted hotdog family 3-hydroxylacyl-ACP dehydratase
MGRPGAGGRVVFAVGRGGAAVAEGAVVWRRGDEAEIPQAVAGAGADPAAAASAAPLALPHQPPARLVEEVLEEGEGWVRCRGRVPAASPFAAGDRAPAVAALELAAQAAAVLEARGRPGGEPRIGYLVRVRDAVLARPHFPVGAPLEVRADFDGGASPLSLYRVAVSLAGAEVLCAALGTYLPGGGSPPALTPRKAG